MRFSDDIAHHVPFLRRYARALTGSQAQGDAYVRATLEAILQSPSFIRGLTPRVALYRVFHIIWSGTHSPATLRTELLQTNRDHFVDRIGAMSLTRREALLLTAMEDFSPSEAAAILGISRHQITEIVEDAIGDLVAPTPASVLIIEDEPMVSMDLANIVEEMGHSVAAVAATHRQAIAATNQSALDLVLADIQLADGGSGIETVNNILHGADVPVVFITAHSERLLTGEGAEPIFLVPKPFATRSVKVAIGQALLLAEDHATPHKYETRSAAP